MKLTNLVLAMAIAVFSANTANAAETTKPTNGGKNLTTLNETIKIIHQRKSVRNFSDKAVTREQLEAIVRAGMAAPTAINTQPWQFLVIDDKKLISKYAEGNRAAFMINKCQALVVICGDMNIGNDRSKAFWVQDVSAATENLLLAVESLGLGAVWTGVYPIEERVKEVKAKFELPENIIPLCVVLVGYPDGTDQPKDKWKPERLHWNKY